MKKPLIVLVDDDRAVLEALEAELSPVFAEIARIESFDDPADVLSSVALWRGEGRPIAVAIVDQKMPGTSGVELLRRLREDAAADPDHPARHMKALLLTGYGGLESAVAAKNEAAVSRYLEKPWSGGVTDHARCLFSDFLAASRLDAHYIFREPRSAHELRQLLSLRYAAYQVTFNFRHVQNQHDAGFRVDAFDAYSRHVGFFRTGLRDSTLVGTLRIAGDERSPVLEWLRHVAAPHEDLAAALEEPRPAALPMLTYLEEGRPVMRLWTALTERGERVVEPGRLAVEAAARAGEQGVRPGPALIECAAAMGFFFLEVQSVILDCNPAHVRFYRPLGFDLVPGTGPRFEPAVGTEIVVLHGPVSAVPAAARERVLPIAGRLRRTGAACRCGTWPKCLPSAYDTGDFSGTDIFCPARACAALATGVVP